jgi:hypothetical protein
MMSQEKAAKFKELYPRASKIIFMYSFGSDGTSNVYIFIEIKPGIKKIKNKANLSICQISIYTEPRSP